MGDDLATLFERAGSDKHMRPALVDAYETITREWRERTGCMAEIGVKCAVEPGQWHGGSVAAWCRWLPKFRVVAVDHSNEALVELLKHAPGDIATACCDQERPDKLRWWLGALRRGDGYDLIVDDGSHSHEHQLACFKELWSLVLVGGYYVIEDVESYGPRGLVTQALMDVVTKEQVLAPERSVYFVGDAIMVKRLR